MNTHAQEKIANVGPAGSSVMQNFELYKPLIELSAAITECRKELKGDLSRRRRSDLRRIERSLEHKLTEQSKALIYRTLNSWDVDESLGKFLSDELNALKEGTEEHWHPEIDNVRVRMARMAEREGRKSTPRRWLERYGWMVAIVVVVVAVLSIRWYSLVDLEYPPETVEGVVQGSAALEKLARYDDTLGERFDDAGVLERVVFWPVKPTREEVDYALEFMRITVETFDSIEAEGVLCGTDQLILPDDGDTAKDYAIARVVTDYINGGAVINYAESGVQLVERAFKRRFFCSESW